MMAQAADAQMQTIEETDVPAEVLIFQPVSDDEESSSDDEYYDASEKIQEGASCQEDLETGSSSVEIPDAKTVIESSATDEKAQTVKSYDASEKIQEGASGSSCQKDLETGSSSIEISDAKTVVESSATDEKAQTVKSDDALDSSIKDAHSSYEESKSVGSSTESAYTFEYRAGGEDNASYVCIGIVDDIKEKDLVKVMQKSRVDHYSAVLSKVDTMMSKCRQLFERDYECQEMNNFQGNLCKHYPERIIVPVAEKSDETGSESFNGVEFDMEVYTNQIKSSISCRLRKRFVAPVILFNKKFISRAGTITVRKTAVFETTKKSPPPRAQRVDESPIKKAAMNIARAVIAASNRGREAAVQLFVPSSIRKLRDVDAQILRTLKIQYICDLMIEDRKKFKHIRLSSSEKINPDIYRDCNIEQMPYPGCQFFKRYHEAKRVPEGLIFNWTRSDVNTEMKLTEDPNLTFPGIEWENYKEWDVVYLTKNYIKILLAYLATGTGGLLVHCVSGWDRTPLFISILRVSLWADGVIHKRLNCKEMAYLTLTYDWYLFGHDLPSRLRKKEEIMHFCFKFLAYIASDEYSITRIFHELPIEQRGHDSVPEFIPGRRSILNEFSSYLLQAYDEFLTPMLG